MTWFYSILADLNFGLLNGLLNEMYRSDFDIISRKREMEGGSKG